MTLEWGILQFCVLVFFKKINHIKQLQSQIFLTASAKLKELQTLGIYNGLWLKDYQAFVRKLRKGGVNIQAFRNRGLRWHAKIFVLSNTTKPILGIIGSSNITRSAFSTSNPFNWECDVVIWTNKPNRIAQRIKRIVIGDLQIGYDVIVADYNPKQNSEITIDQRLKQLVSELNEMKTEIVE